VYHWGSGPRAHDYHHSHNIGMYGGGLFGIWDKIFGYDKEFNKFENERKYKKIKKE
jgi:sterol desaturase/sphingolipid hydroxylase (fatty acid hydroxylase superfamily)